MVSPSYSAMSHRKVKSPAPGFLGGLAELIDLMVLLFITQDTAVQTGGSFHDRWDLTHEYAKGKHPSKAGKHKDTNRLLIKR